jgi:EAL and modified HD-GYP domain-containing signal transduction protein
MQEHPVLGQVTLGYSPLVSRQRTVVATRLTIFPARPDLKPDMPALLRAVSEVWPATANDNPVVVSRVSNGTPGGLRWPVSLNISGESMLQAALARPLPPQLMLEVPAFMLADPAHAAAIKALHAGGSVLLIKGRPLAPLQADMLSCFAHGIVEAHEDRRTGPDTAPGARQVTTIQAAATTTADLNAAFDRGAVATFGWPFGDEPPRTIGREAVASDAGLVVELMNGVDRDVPVARLEAILKRDPTLAFRLLRYLNSPGFGLSVEVTSFGHALMLLGPQRLKRWLAVLLASSSKDPNARPMLFAAMRRGLLLEALVSDSEDAGMRGEIFICGIFSLLDRLLQQPMASLLQSVPMPERVNLALCGQGGPYAPYLALACAIEQESLLDIRESTERLFMGPAEVNRALLGTLGAARLLE